MTRIQLACLDMAGTTVADDGMVERAFEHALVAMSVDDVRGAMSYVRQTMGRSKIEVCRALFADEDEAQTANELFEKEYGARCAAGEAQPIPGAEGAIRTMRDGGTAVCLTTGFSPVTRDTLIQALGWTDLVDLALSPADAGRGRPFPDMILTAVLRLNVDDVRAVAVAGDTTSDLLAGTRAGASIVAGVLTGAHDRADLEVAPHTHILRSIAELPELF